jgi:hypothetical protein
MRYRVEFDRPGVPNRNAVVPRAIKRAATDEPLGIFAKPAGELHAVVEADDEPAAGRAAIKRCAAGDYHYYPSGVLP